MRRMPKTMGLLLALVMLVGIVYVTAMAVEDEQGKHRAYFTVDDVVAKQGEMVTFNVYIKENLGIGAGRIQIACPQISTMKIVRGDWAVDKYGDRIGAGLSNEYLNIYDWYYTEEVIGEGVYCTFTANIVGDPGYYDIQLVASDLSGYGIDENGEDYVVGYNSGEWAHTQTYFATLTIPNDDGTLPQGTMHRAFFDVDDIAVKHGDTVDFNVNITENRGIGAGKVSITCPQLTVSEIKQGDWATDADGNPIGNFTPDFEHNSCTWYYNKEISNDGVYCVYTATVTGDPGIYEIQLIAEDLAGYSVDGNDSVSYTDGQWASKQTRTARVEILPEHETIANGDCGENVKWTLNDIGTLTISGKGSMSDFSWGSSPWFDKKSSIKAVVIENGVTSIGDFAFAQCTSLANITISDSTTSIGQYAFADCTSLANATMSDSVTSIEKYAFSGCSSLTNVTISDSVTSIDEYAFSDCTSLTSITIPKGVTEIGKGVFENCSSLKGIWVDDNNLNYSSDSSGVLFNKDKSELICAPMTITEYNVPNSVTTIADYAFDRCSLLTSISLPKSLTTIGTFAFKECELLTSILIPDSVTTIGNEAFYYCTSLKNLTIPGSVEVMESWIITDCSDITEIIIENGVKKIEEHAITNCSSLKRIVIPESVDDIIVCDYEETKFISVPFPDCTSLIEIIVDDNNPNYTSDEYGALLNKDKTELLQVPCAVTEYVIPETVTKINSWNFYGCSLITDIIIPNGIVSIGTRSFEGCVSLSNVVFPDSLEEINMFAFDGCESLTDVYYTGSEEQWKTIEIGDYNEPLHNATIHYNYVTPISNPAGDIDGDGNVENSDLVTIARYIVGLTEGDTKSAVEAYADMNSDGKVDNADIVTVARLIVGLA